MDFGPFRAIPPWPYLTPKFLRLACVLGQSHGFFVKNKLYHQCLRCHPPRGDGLLFVIIAFSSVPITRFCKSEFMFHFQMIKKKKKKKKKNCQMIWSRYCHVPRKNRRFLGACSYNPQLTLKLPITTTVAALSSACDFKSHSCKQCGPRSDCSSRNVCQNRFEKFARIFSRQHKQRHFQMQVFLAF